MSTTPPNSAETDNSRRMIYIVIIGVSVLLIAGLIYVATRPSTNGNAAGQQQRLEGGLRAGSPEFEQYRERIVLDKPEATEAARPIGDIVMRLTSTARNFTGRTINGLEVYAAVVDSQGKPVKERTVVAIPKPGQTELDPNRTIEVPVMLEGMKKEDDRANIKMEVTAVRFK
jgi:hypothetical protein